MNNVVEIVRRHEATERIVALDHIRTGRQGRAFERKRSKSSGRSVVAMSHPRSLLITPSSLGLFSTRASASASAASERRCGVSALGAQAISGTRHPAAVAGEHNMSAGSGGPAPGPGGSPGGSNPRKFSEKIALHTQRQAEETAAFHEVMMDITSTRLQAQKLRLARAQGPYYGGSLPNVNQIGRGPQDPQGSSGSFPPSPLESARSTRHHGLVERVHRERRFLSPVRPYRNRQVDASPYSSAYLSPPPDPSWRRTNSDSALHTSAMNPPASGDPFAGGGHALRPHGGRRNVFPYPVPPIEENVLDDAKLLPNKAWDAKKFPVMTSRPKSCEVPGINVFVSPEQPSGPAHGVPSALNISGSLPDLSSLHFPSPLPTPLDHDEPAYPGGSAGNLASTLTQLGINAGDVEGGDGVFRHHQQPGTPGSLGTGLANPSLQSSLSNPNILASLSGRSFSGSLSSASLHSSLSNPSLGSSPSLPSSLSSQSLHSSLSSSSLQSAPGGANPAYGCGGGSSYAPALSTSPRRRAQPSPLVLTGAGGDARRQHAKQFSPTLSPTLSSITQGVRLDTSRLPADQRLPPYPLGPLGQLGQQHQGAVQPAHQQQVAHLSQHQAQMVRLQQTAPQNLLNAQHFGTQRACSSQVSSPLAKSGGVTLEPFLHGSLTSQCQLMQEAEQQRSGNLPQLHLTSDPYNDALLNSLLDDSYINMQLGGRPGQQFQGDGPSDAVSRGVLGGGHVDTQAAQQSLDRAALNNQNHKQNQNHNCGSDARQNVPNIILTGDSPPGLSKEITSALSHVPGFEMDPFCLDDPLRMDALALDMLEGDLMLADPAVEDSFRSDRLK
ncbi:CREB-regulated transcription coactivator 2-like isoform X2 [Syngnathoides biaculeatus]|uniref:CREB-regulated transcription coactivator 2-like isoform X2 n=1 Tax=Syngnathoides biaculeatus TaxID=300417 RepID=UPI002ADD4B5E|nr:CREB-regulated transcription coactivator 2-like isoform X2 [Syngnathoides biaculeatus]